MNHDVNMVLSTSHVVVRHNPLFSFVASSVRFLGMFFLCLYVLLKTAPTVVHHGHECESVIQNRPFYFSTKLE